MSRSLQTARTKGQQTRALILRRAFAMAGTVGLEGLSIGSVAKAAKMSKSGLFAHFDSKEALQLEVLETAVQRFVDTVVRPILTEPRGVARVRAFFDNWLAWAGPSDLPGGCVFISAAAELDDRPGTLRDFLVSSQKTALETVARSASIAVEEGHFHAELDVEQFAHDFYAVILAFHFFHRLLGDPESERRARHAFDHLIQRSTAGSSETASPSQTIIVG